MAGSPPRSAPLEQFFRVRPPFVAGRGSRIVVHLAAEHCARVAGSANVGRGEGLVDQARPALVPSSDQTSSSARLASSRARTAGSGAPTAAMASSEGRDPGGVDHEAAAVDAPGCWPRRRGPGRGCRRAAGRGRRHRGGSGGRPVPGPRWASPRPMSISRPGISGRPPASRSSRPGGNRPRPRRGRVGRGPGHRPGTHSRSPCRRRGPGRSGGRVAGGGRRGGRHGPPRWPTRRPGAVARAGWGRGRPPGPSAPGRG